jgi:hypothetical protein
MCSGDLWYSNSYRGRSKKSATLGQGELRPSVAALSERSGKAIEVGDFCYTREAARREETFGRTFRRRHKETFGRAFRRGRETRAERCAGSRSLATSATRGKRQGRGRGWLAGRRQRRSRGRAREVVGESRQGRVAAASGFSEGGSGRNLG